LFIYAKELFVVVSFIGTTATVF